MDEKETSVEIITAARISINPDKRKELFLSISSLLGQVKNERGCRAYRFYKENSEHETFLLIGQWGSLNDWIQHIQSEDFTVLSGCLEILSNEGLDFKVLSQVDEIEALIGNESQ